VISTTPDCSSMERVPLVRDRSSLRLGLAATVKADRDAARKRGVPAVRHRQDRDIDRIARVQRLGGDNLIRRPEPHQLSTGHHTATLSAQAKACSGWWVDSSTPTARASLRDPRTASRTRSWLPKSRLAVGLVENQDPRLLREGAGDQCQLPLAAADAVPIRVRRDARCPRVLIAIAAASRVGCRGSGKGAAMRRTPHQHRISRTVNGKAPAPLCGTYPKVKARRREFQLEMGSPSTRTAPARGGSKPRNRLEQCRFALAIAPEHAKHFTGGNGEIDMVSDRVPRVAVAQILDR